MQPSFLGLHPMLAPHESSPSSDRLAVLVSRRQVMALGVVATVARAEQALAGNDPVVVVDGWVVKASEVRTVPLRPPLHAV